MIDSILGQSAVYLAAALVCVPLAKRIGMGSVLGYLLAGIMIGPFALGFVGHEGENIMHFAEFGVVMMLFLIGLELEPTHFWKMRNQIIGLGSLQLALTTLAISTILLLIGFSLQSAIASGLALSMSSTAIVLQTLKEKGLGNTQAGTGSFAVLLFQDIAVIPILALLPFLAFQTATAAGHDPTLLDGQPPWIKAGGILLAVLLVFILGRYIVVPLMRFITKTSVRELCIAAALLIIVAIALLMKKVGLSPALGAFLAGVLLANSEFRHQLESDIEPFKGLLLGLFFIAVGASINFKLITDSPGLVFSLVASVVAIKAIVLLILGKIFRYSFDQNSIFSIVLSQVGEFAFVLFAFISRLKILDAEWADMLMAVTAISMTITPLLLLVNERFILPHFGTKEAPEQKADVINTVNPVIIAGFSSFGSTVGRFLRANEVGSTILDINSDQVDLLRKMGFKVFYGDATRLEILISAGAESAKVLVVAIDNPATSNQLVSLVKKNFPHIKIMARTGNNLDAFELLDQGVNDIYREFLDAAVRTGVDVLATLGHRRYSASRAGLDFIKYDEKAMRNLAPHRHDESDYISNAKEMIKIQEQLLANDRAVNHTENDHAWDSKKKCVK